MKDQSKTKQALIQELASLRQRIAELGQSESRHQQVEKTLHDFEKRLRLVFEHSSDVIYTLDCDFRVTSVSPSVERYLGYRTEELVGKPFSDINVVAPESLEAAIKDTLQTLAGGTVPTAEYVFIRKDGSRVIGEVSGSPLMENGKIVGLISIARDITERKLAEEELRKRDARFCSYFDLPLHGIAITSPDKGWLEVNDRLCSIMGYSKEEIVRMTWAEMTYPDDIAADVEQFNRVLSGQIEQYTMDKRFIHKDGKVIWTSIAVRCVRESDGSVDYIVGVMEDITERKRVEEALRASEERFRLAINATEDGLWEWDIQTNKEFFSHRWCEIFGYSFDDPELPHTYESWASRIHPDDYDRVIGALSNHLEKDTKYDVDYRHRHKSGEYRWQNSKGQAIFDKSGKPIKMVGCISDITERKRAEEENRILEERLNRAEKMESLGLLAGGVAHDLNNVLGIVVGYAEMILMAADKSSPIRPHLVNIMKGGQRAAAIVDDLLTLARRGVSDREVLNLNKIIADCQKSPEFEKLSSYHHSVKIKTDIDPDLLNISGSSVHLGKTLFNLVSNASEAMTKGGLVTIKTTNQYLDKPIQGYDHIREGDYVVLSIADTGEGISTNDLKRIFEPFYTKKVMGRSGTGLGLAVVWGTVKDHHGYINVESEEGKGSAFTLYFPVTREDITAEAVAIAISEYMGNGESIMVVDDVKEQRDLAAGMLRTLNYNVSSVSSGEEAIVYLKEHQTNLMVLDMIMDPGMDGLDTYRSVLAIHPKQKAIIVSGFSESDRVKAAKDLGAGAYVRKPYVIEKLGLAVRNELDRVAC